MKQMFFYKEIVSLSREAHRELKFDRARADARFASDTHYVPLASTELQHAARDYPILFAGSGEAGGPIALLGLVEGQNPFVTASGQWREGSYVPAFVRRYPFILAHTGSDGTTEESTEGSDYTVCIDRSCSAFTTETGERLFDEEGNNSEMMQSIINFLSQYRADMQRTRAFYQRLDELELLMPRDLRIRGRDGRSYTLKDFRFVNGERLNELEDSDVVSLHRDGYLGWIHAHLISLGNLQRLGLETAPPGGGDEAAAPEARATGGESAAQAEVAAVAEQATEGAGDDGGEATATAKGKAAAGNGSA